MNDCFGNEIYEIPEKYKTLFAMVNSCLKYDRDVAIVVPKPIYEEIYQAMNYGRFPKKNIDQWDGNHAKLFIAQISGEGTQHYNTVFVVNPNDIEEIVMKELVALPDSYNGKQAIVNHITIG